MYYNLCVCGYSPLPQLSLCNKTMRSVFRLGKAGTGKIPKMFAWICIQLQWLTKGRPLAAHALFSGYPFIKRWKDIVSQNDLVSHAHLDSLLCIFLNNQKSFCLFCALIKYGWGFSFDFVWCSDERAKFVWAAHPTEGRTGMGQGKPGAWLSVSICPGRKEKDVTPSIKHHSAQLALYLCQYNY